LTIGRDYRDCASLHHSYGCGVTVNEELLYAGIPMLHVETAAEGKITKFESK